jgi:hypothetical protein
MMLPVPIGRAATGELFPIDILGIPHLFVSYFSHEQIALFYAFLFKNERAISSHATPIFAIASTSHIPRIYAGINNCFISYIKGDEYSSTVPSREAFLTSLSNELKRRRKLKLTNSTSKIADTIFSPLVIILDDVLDIIISNKKTVGLSFLQLLLLGSSVNIHVIAASSHTCGHLLRQLMNTNSLIQSKFKKFFGQETLSNPSIAEMVYTSEDFVFFKNAKDHDYHRLYPLDVCRVC